MNKFEIAITRAFMYFFILLSIIAFISVLFGAWWQIFTGLVCMMIYLALWFELKKEDEQ